MGDSCRDVEGCIGDQLYVSVGQTFLYGVSGMTVERRQIVRHGVHFIAAIIGAGVVVFLSSILVSVVWAGIGRIGVREYVTWAVCALVLWVVLELKDASMRHGRSPERNEARRRGGPVSG